MSRFIRSAVCAVVLSSACTAPVFAAEPEKILVISGKSLECAERYNSAMHIEDTMEAMMRSMMPIMMQQYGGGASQTEREALVLDAIVESTKALMPKMMDDLAPVMAATFTEAEVCGLADFYESPEGQGVVAKMPAFTAASSAVMMEFMPLLQQDMNRRICSKIDCGATPDPKKAPVKAS